MATDFGVDIMQGPDGDIDPYFRLVSGPTVLANSIVRRLSTAVLFYAPGYGYDLTAILGEGFTDQGLINLKRAIETQCYADERVQGATAAVNLNSQARTMTITILLQTASGPFTMVVSVNQLNVSLVGVSG